MPSLKSIRKRIVSVKSTQKITRAMKMVAGARLSRAQARITALRPYAVKTREVLSAVVANAGKAEAANLHPLLQQRPEKRVIYLLLTGDRGLCGAYNTNLNKAAERVWREAQAEGKEASFYTIGRKGRDYLRRRGAPVIQSFDGIWEKLDIQAARQVTDALLEPFKAGEADAIHIIFTQFKSAMTQEVRVDPLLPVVPANLSAEEDGEGPGEAGNSSEYIFEPGRKELLDRLVPMYLEISILRALYESQASEFGARMTAMDSATKNAKEMIARYTLAYNRARQAAITTELMEIIGGSEALKE